MATSVDLRSKLIKIRSVIKKDQMHIPHFIDQTIRSNADAFYMYQELYSMLLYLITDHVLKEKQIDLTYQKFNIQLENVSCISNVGFDLCALIRDNINFYIDMLLEEELYESMTNIQNFKNKFNKE